MRNRVSSILAIALNEWRLWLRSHFILISGSGFTLLLLASCIISALHMSSVAQEREDLQSLAELTFYAQPDRHPHRMVHYGHYSFRIPPPLAFIDPGIDRVTGQAIFLEGHSQNTATLADAKANANLGRFSSLTPAFVYQIFLPLLIIVIGYSSIVRERETRTLDTMLAQGVTGISIFIGKSLALYSIGIVLLTPLLIVVAIAAKNGEAGIASFGLFLVYAVYLFFYTSLVILISSVTRKRNFTLGILVAIWLMSTFLIPRLAVASVGAVTTSVGKIDSDLTMQRELRNIGDGHNAADPAYSGLLNNLLIEHNVEKVEDLPVNFRGVVALYAEAKLTENLNRYSERRMSLELNQSQGMAKFGWLSPFLAISVASRAISGTDLNNHHKFLRETEQLRFDFVQGLNQIHAEKLNYSDDMNRSRDQNAEQRTRVSSDSWKTLEEFRFEPESANKRWQRAIDSVTPLLVWLTVFVLFGLFISKKLEP